MLIETVRKDIVYSKHMLGFLWDLEIIFIVGDTPELNTNLEVGMTLEDKSTWKSD